MKYLALVKDGRLTLDVPTDLPEGSEHELRVVAVHQPGYHAELARLEAWFDGLSADEQRGFDELAPKVTSFNRWVNDNNIPESYEYSKGWWDWIELVQKWTHKLELDDVRVIGHYVVDTPPPVEQLPMPAVLLVRDGISVAVRWDFGAMREWPNEFTLSVRRRSPYRGPLFGLFNPALDLRRDGVSGFGRDWVFGPYRENQSEFTCELADEWDVAMLLRILFHEP
jgi:hypothetical protein